jgi:uncharacterized protein
MLQFLGAVWYGTAMARPTPAAEAARSLNLTSRQISVVDQLLADGATVPFLARYRKEQTGGLDETQIRAVRDALESIRKREERRTYVKRQIESQGSLTEQLRAAIDSAQTLSEIEDLYLPYRKSRTTRASRAQNAGLEPLARRIFAQEGSAWKNDVTRYVCAEFPDLEMVLEGCKDTIAAWIAESPQTRAALRTLFESDARVETKKKREDDRFSDFYAFTQSVRAIRGHRVLGALRAEAAGVVRLTIRPETDSAIRVLEDQHYRGEPLVREAISDSYARLLCPSLEKEIRNQLKQRADEDAIAVFSTNLRQLLLDPPLGERPVLAIDPGFRTGCKTAAIDATGAFLEDTVIYPVEPRNNTAEAEKRIRAMLERHSISVIAVGNGTAGRETEAFIRSLELEGVVIVPVDESGASIYSASEVAQEEFPELDLTVRGAISIGRRLQDPLAELVKIDPKSIGVGQYQHDVDQKALARSLSETVEECVNQVGVNINQASRPLLHYVAGLSDANARAIIAARASAPFRRRTELLEVPGIGSKTFEQAAGFLRIPDGEEPLDATAVHPESYGIARRLLSESDLKSVDLLQFADDEIGLPTLSDIRDELLQPGRDPRTEFSPPEFRDDVTSIEDLSEGMILTGVVTNLTRFGAFVDVGVHQDGLVHVSQIADRYVADPSDELRVRQQVRVKVMNVEPERKRIGLSIREAT